MYEISINHKKGRKSYPIYTKEEADKHDALFMHELMATIEDKKLGTGVSKHWQEMRNLLDWFMKNNAKAYMVLLD